jgi:hypothetical protein
VFLCIVISRPDQTTSICFCGGAGGGHGPGRQVFWAGRLRGASGRLVVKHVRLVRVAHLFYTEAFLEHELPRLQNPDSLTHQAGTDAVPWLPCRVGGLVEDALSSVG